MRSGAFSKKSSAMLVHFSGGVLGRAFGDGEERCKGGDNAAAAHGHTSSLKSPSGMTVVGASAISTSFRNPDTHCRELAHHRHRGHQGLRWVVP